MNKAESLKRLEELQKEEMDQAIMMDEEELDHYIDRYLNFVEW